MSSSMSFNTSTDEILDRHILDLSGHANESVRYDCDDSLKNTSVLALNALINMDLPQSASSPEPAFDITPPIFSVVPNDIQSGSKEEIQNYLRQNFEKFIEEFFEFLVH